MQTVCTSNCTASYGALYDLNYYLHRNLKYHGHIVELGVQYSDLVHRILASDWLASDVGVW